MSRKFLPSIELTEPEINLTPLIDVVFVILIMFIVVVPLLEVDRVDLAATLYQERSGTASTDGVTLHVYPDDSLMLNNKMVHIEELLSTLTIEIAKTPSKKLTLFHDKNGTFGTYQTIKQIAEAVGFKELDVILKPG